MFLKKADTQESKGNLEAFGNTSFFIFSWVLWYAWSLWRTPGLTHYSVETIFYAGTIAMYFLLINPLVPMRKHWILHKRFLQSLFNYPPPPHTLFFILIGYPVCSWAKRDASWERRVSQWVTLNTIVPKSCLAEWENQTKKNNTEKEQ